MKLSLLSLLFVAAASSAYAKDSYYISMNGGPQELLNGVATGTLFVPGLPSSTGLAGSPGTLYQTVSLADVDGDGMLDCMALAQSTVQKGTSAPVDIIISQIGPKGAVIQQVELSQAQLLQVDMPSSDQWQVGSGLNLVFGQPAGSQAILWRLRKRPELLVQYIGSEDCRVGTFIGSSQGGTTFSALHWYSPPMASALGFSPPGGTGCIGPVDIDSSFAASSAGLGDFQSWMDATVAGNGDPLPVTLNYTTDAGNTFSFSFVGSAGGVNENPLGTLMQEKVTIRPERHEIR